MTRLSSACRCATGGKAKHEMGKCPHLQHECSDVCGPHYAKYVREPISKDVRMVSLYSMPREKAQTVIYGEQKIKPPWES